MAVNLVSLREYAIAKLGSRIQGISTNSNEVTPPDTMLLLLKNDPTVYKIKTQSDIDALLAKIRAGGQ